jgi:hypothetical protein
MAMQPTKSKPVELPATPGQPTGAPQGAATTVAPPTTPAEYRALVATRTELSSQLNNVESRHARLVEELKDAPTEARAGMADRLKVLTDRMVQIETELAATGWQISHAPRELQAATTVQPPRAPSQMGPGSITAISIVITIFVLFPMALAAARLMWRRGTRRMDSPRDLEAQQRLKRMEHAVDAMAIEVERISEGQRFLTQLFAKETRPSVLAPAYEEIESRESNTRDS